MEVATSLDEIITETQPIFKKRGAKKSTAVRKRPTTPPPADPDSSGYSSVSDDGEERQVKRQRRTAAVTATSTSASNSKPQDLQATKFAGDRSSQIETSNDATKQSNWFDSDKMDSKNLLGTTRAHPSRETSEPSSDGTYKGASAYQSFIPKNPNAPSRTVGPVKAPTNIRTITVTDFAPDVCKDYKQTGL